MATVEEPAGAMQHSNDADFRAWGLRVAGMLAAVGLVQTADTGQIDWGTVLRPVINAQAGYEIWRFNDTLQATAPIFLKVSYGTSNAATAPGLWVVASTATDGAGDVSAPVSKTTTLLSVRNVATPSSLLPSYCAFINGCFWLSFHYGQIAFAVTRTHNGAGVADGRGFSVYSRAVSDGTSMTVQNVAAATVTTPIVANTNYVAALGQVAATNSLQDGTEIQLVPNFGIFPRLLQLLPISYFRDDIPDFTVFQGVVLGQPRTYMALGYIGFGKGGYVPSTGTYLVTAMPWE